MTIVRNQAGAIVRRSRNLRGLLEHARRAVPLSVTLTDTDGLFLTDAAAGQRVRRYQVDVAFDNGDIAQSFFNDWRVAADWFRDRRSWGGAVTVHGMDAFVARHRGEVTA